MQLSIAGGHLVMLSFNLEDFAEIAALRPREKAVLLWQRLSEGSHFSLTLLKVKRKRMREEGSPSECRDAVAITVYTR